jgi:hypothetical protein
VGPGQDTITGNGGGDTFIYKFATESTGKAYDIIAGFHFATDTFALPEAVTAIDPTVTTGVLDSADFNPELSAAIGKVQLRPHQAVLFTPDSGDLAGHTFLVVDANGRAGYQGKEDFVFGLQDSVGSHLALHDFVLSG